ncbi:hypothetical protein SRHO_G00164990 [Serrasalmus rhombeus]
MAGEARPELVGKRFLCVSGEEPLELGDIGRWAWRSGVIRAVSHRDTDTQELTVTGQFSLDETPPRLFSRLSACFRRRSDAAVSASSPGDRGERSELLSRWAEPRSWSWYCFSDGWFLQNVPTFERNAVIFRRFKSSFVRRRSVNSRPSRACGQPGLLFPVGACMCSRALRRLRAAAGDIPECRLAVFA